MFQASDDANNGSSRSAPPSVTSYRGYYSNPVNEQPPGGSTDAIDQDYTDGPAISPFSQNDNVRLSNENANLRLLLKINETEIERLTEELNKTKQASTEKDHQISLLKDTVQTYQDDFSLEQKEHQKSRDRGIELEYELDLANKQLCQFQETRMENLAQRRREALDRHKEDYYQGLGKTDTAGVYGADICQTDCPIDDEGVDEVDCCGPVDAAMTRSSFFLECHRCKRGFLKNMIADYLDHIENCSS